MARRMMSERMFSMAPIVVAVVSGAFIAMLMPATWMTATVFVMTALTVAWLYMKGRRSSR